MDSKIVDKVRKLLSLAGNNSSEAEAQSAMLKAQALLAENGLSMSDVGDAEPIKKEILQSEATKVSKGSWWYFQLANVIGNNFRCYTFINKHVGFIQGQAVVFMGLKDDVEICKLIFTFAKTFIEKSAMKLRRKIRAQGRSTNGCMNDYVAGFLAGLSEQFKEQVDRENWGLILVKDTDLVQAYDAMTFSKGKARSVNRAFNADAYEKGFKDGKTFDTENKKAIQR